MRIAFNTRHFSQHFQSWGAQIEDFLPCLRVAKPDVRALDVNMLPAQCKNFTKAGTSEQEKADCSDDEYGFGFLALRSLQHPS